MLQNNKNNYKGGYSTEIASRYVGVNLPLINVTEKPEAIHMYDQDAHRYTDDVVSYRIYVVQNYGDYLQNPIAVRVNSKIPAEFKFGQKLRLKNLKGCLIRDKNGFSKPYFKADSVEILNEEKGNEK